MEKKKINPAIIIGAAAGALAAIAIAVIIIISVADGNHRKVQKNIDLGNRYISEMDYEQAIAAFELALKIDPKSEEAYIGIVTAYANLGEFETALGYAEQGIEKTGSDALKEWRDYLKDVLDGGNGGNFGDNTSGSGNDGNGADDDAAAQEENNLQYYFKNCWENPLTPDELTIFGRDIHEINKDNFISLAMADGFDEEVLYGNVDGSIVISYEDPVGLCHAGFFGYEDSSVAASVTVERRFSVDEVYCHALDFREINVGDSMQDFLTKLGLTHVDEIVEIMREAAYHVGKDSDWMSKHFYFSTFYPYEKSSGETEYITFNMVGCTYTTLDDGTVLMEPAMHYDSDELYMEFEFDNKMQLERITFYPK